MGDCDNWLMSCFVIMNAVPDNSQHGYFIVLFFSQYSKSVPQEVLVTWNSFDLEIGSSGPLPAT